MEQDAFREGLMHHRTRHEGPPRRLASGMQQEIDRDIRPGDCAPELVEQGKPVMVSKPAIRRCDEQINIGIGPGFSPGAGAKETNLRIGDELANGGGHGPLDWVIRGYGGHGCTRYTFITSSPRWLITFTAMRPVEGLANGTETSLLRDSQASKSISALSELFRLL